jgi:hypothetical protein
MVPGADGGNLLAILGFLGLAAMGYTIALVAIVYLYAELTTR